MKKVRAICVGTIFCLLMAFAAAITGVRLLVSAENDSSHTYQDVENVSYTLFGEKRIKSSQYLYNFNDSPDFVYVDFEDYGYAVYLRENLELLEYAPTGSLPYENTEEKKYYGGPTNYFYKEEERFVNVASQKSILISDSDKKVYSQELVELFSANDFAGGNKRNNRQYKNVPAEPIKTDTFITGANPPSLNDEGRRPADPVGSSGTKLYT